VVRVLLDEIGILPFDAPLGPSSRA
jgi:hypothetical protein